MNTRLLYLLVILFAVAGATSAQDKPQKSYTNRIIVRIDGNPITEFDLNLFMRYSDPEFFKLPELIADPERLASLQEGRQLAALQDLVRVRTVLALAKKKNFEIPEAHRRELKKKFLKEKARKFSSAEKYREHLASRGLTGEQVFSFELDRELAVELQHNEYKKMGDVRPEDIRTTFECHRDKFKKPPHYYIRHFAVMKKSGNRTPEEAKKIIEDALTAVRAGASFEKLAGNSSEAEDSATGGALDWVEGNASLLSPIPGTVEKMEVGNISSVIEAGGAYHFVRLEKKNPGRRLEFEEVCERIETILKNRNWRRAKAAVIENALKTVSFNPERMIFSSGRGVRWQDFLKGNISVRKTKGIE